jgi:serine/threonine protein kinase
MQAQLFVTVGADKGRVFDVPVHDSSFVGRSRSAAFCLNDAGVSRIHCQIEFDGNTIRVADLKSTHGTFVNDQRVEGQQELHSGDLIRVGSTLLLLLCRDASEQSTLDPMHMPVPAAAEVPRNTPPEIEWAPAAPVARAAQPENIDELVGTTLASYQVGAIVAKGHTGVVFRARDGRTGKEVALKVLQPQFSTTEEDKQRFGRAMRTMLPLRHPNLVAIHNAGKSGLYRWIAMEFVDGESLRQRIQRLGVAGMLDWRQVHRIAVDISRALEYAHSKKIIHRNITPTNILIRTEDKVAKLGDLMLVKALEGNLAADVTHLGELVGDVSYLSPEGTLGQGSLDGRSDIYSLGATLYTALTGRPPFEAGTPARLIRKIQEQAPKRPSECQNYLPGLIDALVLRMLDKRPENRFQTAAELLAELERIRSVLGMA